MKKLIDRLAKEFGLTVTVEHYRQDKKYVFINNCNGSLMSDAPIWAFKTKENYVNVAYDVSATSDDKFAFHSIIYFDNYEKAKKHLTKILNKIKEIKIKKKIELIEKDF